MRWVSTTVTFGMLLSIMSMSSAAKDLTVADWARGISHHQLEVRKRAIGTLLVMARKGERIDEAHQTLLECVRRELSFSTAEETELRHFQAIEALAYANPDLIAQSVVEEILSRVQSDTIVDNGSSYLEALYLMAALEVDVDDLLLEILHKHRQLIDHPKTRTLLREDKLMYCVAKHVKDRQRAGRTVAALMERRLRESWQERHGAGDNDLRSVWLCAEHCGGLFPLLREYYLKSAQGNFGPDASWRKSSLRLISALAVYHDDAWEFFLNYLSDPFTEENKKYMLASFAETLLSAPPQVQRECRTKFEALHEAMPGWHHLPVQVTPTSEGKERMKAFAQLVESEREVG